MSGKRIKRRHAAPEWLKLDNAGKIYPATRSFGWMAVYRLSVTLDEPVDETLLNQALRTTVKRLPILLTVCGAACFGFIWSSRKACRAFSPTRSTPACLSPPGATDTLCSACACTTAA